LVTGQTPQERVEDVLNVSKLGLRHLGVEDLLVELLSRVREILDADTAAVLLLDRGGTYLEARAACGIEEEVRQGFRVPVGHGFAGTVAASKRPVFVNEVGPATVMNPILWEKGIRVMLGVPLLAGANVTGVLHVGRIVQRPFGEADAELLGAVAERVAAAIQAQQLAVERAAADLLERSLLPPKLPSCPGLEFASRYVTREGRAVGGDWYDAFTLPTRVLWVVIGDVAGHGLEAAVVMGRVRSALRAYALEDHPPDEVVRLVDRKVRHFEVGTMITLACAASAPPYDRFQVVSAGHPPPVVVAPGRPASLVDLDVLPPLGSVYDFRRAPTTVALPLGGAMVFYTDGLVERRGEHLDTGFARLVAAVTADGAESICRAVMHDMIGSQRPEDDVAMIALRRTNDTARRDRSTGDGEELAGGAPPDNLAVD
jgi:phosphoserine phosphatase RsbU/P